MHRAEQRTQITHHLINAMGGLVPLPELKKRLAAFEGAWPQIKPILHGGKIERSLLMQVFQEVRDVKIEDVADHAPVVVVPKKRRHEGKTGSAIKGKPARSLSDKDREARQEALEECIRSLEEGLLSEPVTVHGYKAQVEEVSERQGWQPSKVLIFKHGQTHHTYIPLGWGQPLIEIYYFLDLVDTRWDASHGTDVTEATWKPVLYDKSAQYRFNDIVCLRLEDKKMQTFEKEAIWRGMGADTTRKKVFLISIDLPLTGSSLEACVKKFSGVAQKIKNQTVPKSPAEAFVAPEITEKPLTMLQQKLYPPLKHFFTWEEKHEPVDVFAPLIDSYILGEVALDDKRLLKTIQQVDEQLRYSLDDFNRSATHVHGLDEVESLRLEWEYYMKNVNRSCTGGYVDREIRSIDQATTKPRQESNGGTAAVCREGFSVIAVGGLSNNPGTWGHAKSVISRLCRFAMVLMLKHGRSPIREPSYSTILLSSSLKILLPFFVAAQRRLFCNQSDTVRHKVSDINYIKAHLMFLASNLSSKSKTLMQILEKQQKDLDVIAHSLTRCANRLLYKFTDKRASALELGKTPEFEKFEQIYVQTLHRILQSSRVTEGDQVRHEPSAQMVKELGLALGLRLNNGCRPESLASMEVGFTVFTLGSLIRLETARAHKRLEENKDKMFAYAKGVARQFLDTFSTHHTDKYRDNFAKFEPYLVANLKLGYTLLKNQVENNKVEGFFLFVSLAFHDWAALSVLSKGSTLCPSHEEVDLLEDYLVLREKDAQAQNWKEAYEWMCEHDTSPLDLMINLVEKRELECEEDLTAEEWRNLERKDQRLIAFTNKQQCGSNRSRLINTLLRRVAKNVAKEVKLKDTQKYTWYGARHEVITAVRTRLEKSAGLMNYFTRGKLDEAGLNSIIPEWFGNQELTNQKYDMTNYWMMSDTIRLYVDNNMDIERSTRMAATLGLRGFDDLMNALPDAFGRAVHKQKQKNVSAGSKGLDFQECLEALREWAPPPGVGYVEIDGFRVISFEPLEPEILEDGTRKCPSFVYANVLDSDDDESDLEDETDVEDEDEEEDDLFRYDLSTQMLSLEKVLKHIKGDSSGSRGSSRTARTEVRSEAASGGDSSSGSSRTARTEVRSEAATGSGGPSPPRRGRPRSAEARRKSNPYQTLYRTKSNKSEFSSSGFGTKWLAEGQTFMNDGVVCKVTRVMDWYLYYTNEKCQDREQCLNSADFDRKKRLITSPDEDGETWEDLVNKLPKARRTRNVRSRVSE